MKSQYLLKMVEEQFLEEGGDETWLIAGLNAVPKKLQVLSLLVNILSNQPWKVSSEEFKGLKSYWTLPELCEVAVVVVHYNKLCIIEESLKNVVMVETNNYLPKRIPLLDEEIKYILNLHYEESNISLNLSPRHNLLKFPQIKRAVCNYIEKNLRILPRRLQLLEHNKIIWYEISHNKIY